MGFLDVTYDVRLAPGTEPLQRQHLLPDLPGSQPLALPVIDRVGRGIQLHGRAVEAGAVAGAVAGAAAVHGAGAAGRIVGAAGGAIAGAAAAAWAIDGVGPDRDAKPVTLPGAHVADGTAHADEHVRVLTYNIRGGIGPHGFGASDADFDALAATIRSVDPDVLLLQEVDQFALRSTWHDSLGQVASRLGATSAAVSSPGNLATGRLEGSGVMTFHGFRIDDARGVVHGDPEGSGVVRRAKGWVVTAGHAIDSLTHAGVSRRLPGSLTEYSPRETLDTMVRTPAGNDVRVVTGHYSGSNADHDYQLLYQQPLFQALGAWRGATIFGGDYNTRSGSKNGAREAGWAREAGLADTFTSVGIDPKDPARGSTVNDPSPVPIDRIYASGQFQASGTHVVRDDPDPASDHYGVVTDLHLTPTGQAPVA